MRACLGGEDVIKGKYGYFEPETFLPAPFINSDPTRYAQYLARAIFYNITENTFDGFLGSVFRKKVDTSLPKYLDYSLTNITGNGVGLNGFSKEVVSEVLGVGHLGIISEYRNGIAVNALYPAESILGYELDDDGRLILVRLLETVTKSLADNFQQSTVKRYRVLGLDNKGYYQQEYNDQEKPIGEPFYPLDFNKKRFDFIPFQFVGSENNTPTPDKPPLLSIADINIGHYRNSADHEENLSICGQGTLFASSELTPKQFWEANPEGLKIGSRRGHFLGKEGRAELLQLNEAQAIDKAMARKEEVMVALGARFIMDRSGQRTAQESLISESQQNSPLNTVVTNCVEAVSNVLFWDAKFMAPSPNHDDIDYDLNRKFFDVTLTAQEVAAMIMLKDNGIWAKSDVRRRVRSANWMPGDRTDEQIDQEIEDNLE